jgi:hypothetical protein
LSSHHGCSKTELTHGVESLGDSAAVTAVGVSV